MENRVRSQHHLRIDPWIKLMFDESPTQWEFQDPKMEVRKRTRFLALYMVGTSNQSVPEMAIGLQVMIKSPIYTNLYPDVVIIH